MRVGVGLEPGVLSASPLPEGLALCTFEDMLSFEGPFSIGKKFRSAVL